VSAVYPEDELTEAGRALAREILANSPVGVRLTKECLNMSVDAGCLESVIAMEDRQQILTSTTGDVREGIAAFMEKRPAQYRDA